MTQVAAPPEPSPPAPERSATGGRWRTVALVLLLALVAVSVVGWQWLGRQPSLTAGSSMMAPLGAPAVNDGLRDTRYVFSGEPGTRVHLEVTFRNDGRFPVVVRPPARSPYGGLVGRWLTSARFGHSPHCNGCSPLDQSSANGSKVRLQPGEEGLMILDLQVGRCPVLMGGPTTISDIDGFDMRTTTLGIDRVQHVDLLRLPLTVTGSQEVPGC
jgi:hypothetical protein